MSEEWPEIVSFAVLFSLIVSITGAYPFQHHTKYSVQCPLLLVISYLSYQSTISYKWEEDMDLDLSDYEGAVLIFSNEIEDPN
jgi:hypothetical protein